MPTEPVFEKLTVREKAGEVLSQIKVECKTDIPTEIVERMLNENASATVTLGEIRKGRAEINGKVTFFLCYSTADGIKKAECGAEVKDSLVSDLIEDGDRINLYCRADKPEVDLSGLKASVSVYLTVRGVVFRKREYPILTGGENVFTDERTVNVIKHLGSPLSVYTVEEEFEIPFAVREVLCHRAEACISSVQCGVGTVVCDGEIYLTEILLQSGEKSDIIRENKVLSFRAEIACDDAMPQSTASCRVNVKSLKTDIAVDEEKNLSAVTVNVQLSLSAEAYSLEEKVLVKDAFSVERELSLKRERAVFSAESEPFSVYAKFTGTVAAEGLENAKIVAVISEKTEIASCEKTDGEISVGGVATLNVMFIDGDGKPFSRKAEMPFEHRLPFDGAGKIDVIAVPKCAKARIANGSGLECETETVFTVYEEKETAAEVITEAAVGEEKTENDHAISVYIPLEGEDLWELAKRLNVAPETLVLTNKELRFPLTGKERITVYRQK